MNQSPSPKQSKLLHTLISLMIILMQVTLPFGATVAAFRATPQMVGDLASQLGFGERSAQAIEQAIGMLPQLIGAPQTAQAASGGIEYRVTFNAGLGRYEVYLRPTATPSAPNQTVTAQVTLKAPHVTGLGSFNPVTVIAQVPGTDWALTSRTNAPSEDPSADYLSFELSFPTNNHSAINWQSGQEVLAFSFANSGSCAGVVTVMDNSDPFNTLPNSANTNPGNQIEVVGLGDDPGNDYLGNYGSAALCSASPGIEYRVAYNSGANRYEVWMRPTVTPNLPNQTVTAQVTLKAPHVAGSLAFTPTNLIPYTDTLWSLGSLVRSPSEDANADYLSFDVSFPTNHTGTFAWQAGVERLVFRFQNSLCAGPVTVMEDSDPFNSLPNSVGTNPGQQIDVVGLGSDPGNDYIGTYGLGQGDCDRDGDGVVNGSDLDDDGDGILDSVEGGLAVDTDNDGVPNGLDLDADNDGIPDNVEAQSTAGYVAPSGNDSDNDGLDNAYEGAGNAGLTPVNSDGADTADYIDLDSDNEGGNDASESGNINAGESYADVNGSLNNGADDLPDADNDGEASFRDNSEVLGAGIQYKLVYNPTTTRYEVWMRPTATPGAPNQTSTAQVTLKAPHVAGSLAFSPTNLVPYTDTLWSLGSVVRSPSEDVSADYLSFDVSFPTNHTGTFAWQAGVERLVFSFQNTLCAGPVAIMEDSDAFNQLPNSTNTNPGQAIDVVSLASDPGNDFIGTYGLGQGDCDRDGDGAVNGSDLDDDGDGILDSVEGGLTVDTDNDGIPNNLDLDADGDGIPDNIEAQSTAGYVAPSGSDSDNDGLDNAYEGAGDAGLTPVNTDGDSGPALPDYLDIDSDNAQGNDSSEAGLTLSGTDADQDGIDDGADSNDSAFGPTNAGVANPSTTYPNSNSSGDVDYRDAVTTAPDLVTTLGQPTPSLMAGVQNNLPVTVTNQGDAPASGPITTTVTLPAGVSAPAIFSGGNGWSCTTSGQTVTCVNAGSLNNGVSSNLIVPITPAAAGGPVTINATTTPVSGENNTGNNAAAPLTTSTGIAAFVDGCFAVTVTLSGAQETPPNNSTATGSAVVLVNTNANTLDYNLTFSGLTPNMAHIHGFSAPGVSSGVVHNLPGLTSPQMSQWGFAEGDQANILAGLSYFNLHTAAFGGGEIRGQIGALAPAVCPAVILPVKVILGGAYQSSTGLMRTQLRTLSDFPLVSPYGGSATITNSAVLTANNIVDWVWVELRDSTTPATVVASQAGLLQHDGDVVGVNGVSPLSFSGLASNTVYVAVKHRNHLAVMTANPVTLSDSTATVDFTAPATAVYGSNARRTIGSKTVLWAGNANGNTNVIGAGPNNDVSSVLLTVFSDPGNGNFNVNYIVPGYKRSDVNMDGKTIGAGPNNDVNTVLTTVFSHPSNTTFAANYIVLQQLP